MYIIHSNSRLIAKLILFIFITALFGGCSRVVNYSDLDEIERDDGMGDSIRWVYCGINGYNHVFIKFYKNSINSTAYEKIYIPKDQLIVKIKFEKNSSGKVSDVDGVNLKSLLNDSTH